MSNNPPRELVLVADVHLEHNDDLGIETGVAWMKKAIQAADETAFRTLVVAGDFTQNARIGGLVLGAAESIFEYAERMNVSIILMAGNHDVDRDGIAISSALGKYRDRVKRAVNDVRSFVVEDKYDSNGMFAHVVCVPFGVSLEKAMPHVKKAAVGGGSKTLVVAHGDVKGAVYDNISKHKAKRGISMSLINEITNRNAVVALGHIHNPQDLSVRAFYIGAIGQFRYDSMGQQRGYVTFDPATGKWRRHPMVGGKWPIFLESSWADWKESPYDLDGFHMAFVRIKAEANDPDNEAIRSAVMADGAHSVKIVRQKVRVKKTKAETTITVSDPLRTMFMRYLDETKKEEKDKQRLSGRIESVFQQVE